MRREAGLALLATLVAACGSGLSTQVTAPVAVPPDVVVEHLERPYTIEGEDAVTLRDQMRARGPGSFGRFEWRIFTRYRWGAVQGPSIDPSASRATECELKAIEITLTLTTIMPRWEPPPTASEELVDRWTEFERNLRIHEEGHRDIALRAAGEVRNRLRDLRTPNCAFMRRQAEQLRTSIVDKWNERSREYDEETKRGTTQGAVWPPRPRVAGGGG